MTIPVMRKESLKKNSVAFNFRRLFEKKKHSSNIKPCTVMRACSSCTNKETTKHCDPTYWDKPEQQGQ